MKKIDFMLTAFRDGLQSAYGSRVLSADYLPVVEACAQAGIEHFESGGGALFQSSFFYCNENAFDVMDAFRQAAGKGARLQTLARGMALVGLEGQSSEVIRLHASLFKRHGVDIVRNFDALNDVDNLRFSGACIREAGLKHELAIAMMELPPDASMLRGSEFYLNVLRRILDEGVLFDSLCFKDASGTCTPKTVHEVVKGARKLLGSKARIVFHGHDTAGLGVEACIGAIEAGVDQVDLSLAPCSGGTCQPDVLSLWHALRGTEYSLDMDPHRVIALEERYKEALKAYFLPPEATRVDPLVSFFPMPGGALTSNTQMLRDNGLIDRYREVVKAMGEAIVKGGMGSSVTPVSQFYFQQAFNNVMYGPWNRIADGYGKMVLGYFGKTPEEPDPEVVRLAIAQLNLPPATRHPLEINDADPKKSLASARAVLEAEGIPVTEENLFIQAICHEKGLLYLKGEAHPMVDRTELATGFSGAPPAVAQPPRPVPAAVAEAAAKAAGLHGADEVTVRINNKAFGVRFTADGVTVNGVSYGFSVAPGMDEEAIAATAALSGATGAPAIATTLAVDSQLSGILTRLYKKAGDKVAVGETVMVIDAMGVEVPVNSRHSGIIQDVFVHLGTQIEAGAPLFRLSTIIHGSEKTVSHAAEAKVAATADGKEARLNSPIAGLVLRIYKERGERVRHGESVLVLESLKMETPINCPVEGIIDTIAVKRGDIVKEGDLLATITKKREER
jgi:pyruvate carboxylase subunit B